MEILKNIRSDSKIIDLSNRYFLYFSYNFSKIDDLKPLLPILSKFINLQSLNISNNKISYLPPTLATLQNLQSLNILDNPFTNLSDAISVLQNLAKLEELSITLSKKEEVSLVLSNLTNLKILNGNSNFL